MKTISRSALLVVAILAWGLSDSRSQNAPAAVLTSCKGIVTVIHAGTSAAASFGVGLSDGDEVKTGAGGEAEIMFPAGNWVQIGPNSSMRIKAHSATAPAGSGEKTEAEKKAANTGSFEVVQSFLKLKNSEGSSAIGGLRSGTKTARLAAVSPCQTRVRSAEPVFKWNIDDPSTELKLTVYGESSTLWQTNVSNTTMATYPADAPGLKPGVSYSWTLETTDPLVSPPLRTSASFFEIIAPADATRLDSDLSQLDATKPGAVTYHLTRASLYFDRGLVDEAITETENALAADPNNQSLRSILARLYADTGRTQDAMTELNKTRK
ncbi:MAG TPA: tetratricopeptide repeat protein [Candidatus Krumholzibacteria bacterium]|nr:tetratricopeptide repeat protein [Candidatus Krumholzibacteria bacterium]